MDFVKVGDTYLFKDGGVYYIGTVLEDFSTESMYQYRIRMEQTREKIYPFFRISYQKPLDAYSFVNPILLEPTELEGWKNDPKFWNWEFKHFQLEFDFDEFKLLLSDNLKLEYIFKEEPKPRQKRNWLSSFLKEKDKIDSSFCFSDENSSIMVFTSSHKFLFTRSKDNQINLEIINPTVHADDINELYFRTKTKILDRLAVITNKPVTQL
jgi:hypothetical protein